MTKTFTGVNQEFGTATGSNVNSGSGTSTFDDPPSDSTNLVITSNEGDSDPNLFEIGETYDAQFDVGGQTIFLEDAEVVRSDAAPGSGGIVVLEGTNQFGEVAQVIWTPNFSLQDWYDSATSGGNEAAFYTSDQNSSYSHRVTCFASETVVQTPNGPRLVDQFSAGDKVLSFEGDEYQILWVGRRAVLGRGAGCPVLFEPGSIGNRDPLRLSQQHRILVTSPLAELLFGDAQVLVPAKAMINGNDIRYAPCDQVTYIHLLLDSHQILNAARGAPCESLLPGDMTIEIVCPSAFETSYRAAHPVLTFREALHIVGSSVIPQHRTKALI